MIYTILRYLSAAILIYFSIVGAGHTFFGSEPASLPLAVSVYGVFCLAPLMILFFGLGASDVDIPRKRERDDSEASNNN
jgi:hypothetical protein